MKTQLLVRLAVLFLGSGLARPPGLRADLLEHWTAQQVSTSSYTLEFIARGFSQYVAYGWFSDYGVILTSSDGMTWWKVLDGSEPGPGQGFSYALALTRTGNKFFAFGGFGISAVSDNGVAWTTFTFPNAYGVAYGASVYAAVVNDIYTFPPKMDVWTATNGLSWTPHHLNGSMGDIAYGAGLFVAIGVNNGLTNDSGRTYTSTGGNLWTKRDILGGSKISFVRSLFIVPYTNGTNLVSADGMNWAALSTGIPYLIGRPTFANGLILASASSYLASSVDGTNWTQYARTMPGKGDSIVSDGFRLIRVGGTPQAPPFAYNGFVYRSEPLVSLGVSNGSGYVLVSGLVGRAYKIESIDTLSNSVANNWQVRFTGPLQSNPFLWSDPTATNLTQRFYRSALLP
jgi:hypothetical protein